MSNCLDYCTSLRSIHNLCKLYKTIPFHLNQYVYQPQNNYQHEHFTLQQQHFWHVHEHLGHVHEHFGHPHEHSGHAHEHFGNVQEHLRQPGLRQDKHLSCHLGQRQHLVQLSFEQLRQLGSLHLTWQQQLVEMVVSDLFGRRRVCLIFLSLISVVMHSISWINLQRWRM